MFRQILGLNLHAVSPKAAGITPSPRAGLAVVLALALAGCATNPAQEGQRLLAPVPAEQLGEARALEAKGDTAGAAKYYLELAEKAKPPTREQLRLEAARAQLAAGQAREADKVLSETSQKDLTQGQQQTALLLGADVALQLGRPQEAIDRLNRVQTMGLPAELRAERLGTLAAAYRLKGQPEQAATTLNELDGLLKDPNQRLANQVSLVQGLAALGPTELARIGKGGSGNLRGWAEVAQMFGSASAADAALEQRYAAWRRGQLLHPALPNLPQGYFGAQAGGYATQDQIKVLLPTSGGFAGGAYGAAIGAIREGILTAQRTDEAATRPQVSFADSTKGKPGALVAAAASGGAKYVIGPLQKGEVDALLAGPALPVPTLALNRGVKTGRSPANLFQYALSPEDEGTSVANAAWAAGHRSAYVLQPGTPWAARLVDAFRNQWISVGGRISGQKGYAEKGDNAGLVQGLLAGADKGAFVFLVASKEAARALWPQIRAAGGLPAYATSLVNNGDFDPAADQALVGLNFVDIPWMLADDDGPLSRRALRRTNPRIQGGDQRLYAMGVDAYRVVPRLTDLAKRPGSFYAGQTGALSLDGAGRVHRQLVVGQFTTNGVALAGTPARDQAN